MSCFAFDLPKIIERAKAVAGDGRQNTNRSDGRPDRHYDPFFTVICDADGCCTGPSGVQ